MIQQQKAFQGVENNSVLVMIFFIFYLNVVFGIYKNDRDNESIDMRT